MSSDAKLRELEELRSRVQQLERELDPSQLGAEPAWPPQRFYTIYHILTGASFGALGALTSLLFTVIAPFILQHEPAYLIQVYLTFPLGESARHLDNDLIPPIGGLFFLAAGTLLGIPLHLILARWFTQSGWPIQFVIATVLSIALWGVLFPGLIEHLQPRLSGENWIMEKTPVWVAVATLLVFGWTVLLLQPLGRFVAARPSSTEA